MVPRLFSTRAAQTLGPRKTCLQGDLNLGLKELLMLLYVANSRNPLECRDPEDIKRRFSQPAAVHRPSFTLSITLADSYPSQSAPNCS